MTQIIAEQSFWEIFPDARLGILAVHGIDNAPRFDAAIASRLETAHELALQNVPNATWTDNDMVRRWRDAFQKFKTKKGARSSIEALLKRVSNGNTIGSINPLVDVYNAISLEFGVPVGGEDLAAISGDIRLTIAAGGESFLPLGGEGNDPALPGEVIYADDEGAICRCWNWREAERTMLTDATTDAIMVIEAVDATTDDMFHSALAALQTSIETLLGGQVTAHVLTRQNPAVDIN